MLEHTYQPQKLEPYIQARWQEAKAYEVSEEAGKEKFYCLAMLPYPSGHLHMGHVRNYTIADMAARYQAMLGKNVLQPMGWDAFGLPAENAAIKHAVGPAKWTYENIKSMREQLQRLGFAYDWRRELATCQPEYYRWEQWFFLQLYKKGLVYKKKALVNWDPLDQTVLANEQVVDGCGWRSGVPVEKREISQWFIKTTAYADELLEGLDKLPDWPEQVKTMQRNWIGRSQGANVEFTVDGEEDLHTFTTRADTLMGVSYLAISPQHPLAQKAGKTDKAIAAFIDQCQHGGTAEAELATQEKLGIATGYQAIHPISQARLPVWIANFVVMDYGTGAVMSVPAHDQRDYEFAKKYHLPIKQVLEIDNPDNDLEQAALLGFGKLINSGRYDGLTSEQALKDITKALEKIAKGQSHIQYRLRDWGISRQRYWGAPIPMIICEHCEAVPVPEKDLPVVLPEDVTLTKPGSPLSDISEFVDVACPQCGKPAKRETDTFDTFFESSWYYARYTSYDQQQAMLDERANYWLSVDYYVGGIEHAVMHLLYARFFHKAMRDCGLLNTDEPFTNYLPQGMVLKDGAKMSKSKGNTVDPQALIAQYGADTVRLFMMFAAPPEQSLEWSDSGVEGAFRFLKRIWNFAAQHQAAIKKTITENTRVDWQQTSADYRKLRQLIHSDLQQANADMARSQFNTVISAAMKILNHLSKVMSMSTDDMIWQQALMTETFAILLRLLAPATPYISDYLWVELGYGKSILTAAWPQADKTALQADDMELVIQVNGKLRGRVTVPANAVKEEILAASASVVKLELENKQRIKDIYVPGKLVSFVVKDKTKT